MKDQEVIEKDLFEVNQRQTMNQPINYPDAKKHQVISFIKSGIRIAACLVGIWGFYEIGFLGLLIAEIVGIKEELV
jgi:hypothetical protein